MEWFKKDSTKDVIFPNNNGVNKIERFMGCETIKMRKDESDHAEARTNDTRKYFMLTF